MSKTEVPLPTDRVYVGTQLDRGIAIKVAERARRDETSVASILRRAVKMFLSTP